MSDTMIICRLNKRGWCVLGVIGALIVLYFLSSKKHIGSLKGNVISVGQLLKQCIFLTEEAGGIIKLGYNKRKLNTRLKANAGGPKNEPLTDIDIMSHRIITSVLSKSFAGVQIISEEHPPALPNDQIVFPPPETFHTNYSRVPTDDLYLPASDLSVWVDPLDATQEFTEGLLECVTVMICITHRNFPLAGVIHQPFLNRTYWSWGKYALSSDLVHLMTDHQKPSTSPPDTINVTLSRSHLNAKTFESRVNQLLSPLHAKLVPAGGSGFKVLNLIGGQAQAYIHPASIRRWDTCAAQAVLESTGGRMVGLDGSRISYDPDGEVKIPASVGIFATANASLNEAWRLKLQALLQKP